MPRLPEWLGISEKRWSKKPDEEFRPAKTAWDWLQLAIVPVILAIAAIAFNTSQASREREREDARTRKDRLIALETRRDDVLQSYLQQMSELMLDRHLLQSPPGSEISGVARTLTITALRRLDGKRKGEVVRFLHESNLIRADPGRRYRTAVVDLENADLRHVDLTAAYLGGAALRHVDLRHAVLTDALLADADLSESRLQHASFEAAYLDHASLVRACLTDVRFTDAELNHTNLSGSDAVRIDLTSAHISGWRLAGARWADVTLKRTTHGEAFHGVGRNWNAIFPDSWGPTGMPLTEKERRAICSSEADRLGFPKGLSLPLAPPRRPNR